MAIGVLLIIVIGLLILANLIFPNKYMYFILLCMLLVIPCESQGIYSGVAYSASGYINISCIGYGTIVLFIFYILKMKKFNKKITTGLVVCITIIFAIRLLVDGQNVLSNKLLDNYILPMALALLIVSDFKKEWFPEFLKIMYRVILFGAVIACIEYITGKSIFFHEYYLQTCGWYNQIYAATQWLPFRSTSLFGHPLVGGVYYLFGVVYLVNNEKIIKNKVLTIIQFVILLAAILSTNTRSTLIVLGIYLGLKLLLMKKRVSKILLIGLVIAIIIYVKFFFNFDNLYEQLFARDVTGSSYLVRVTALLNIIHIPFKTILLGNGYNSTQDVLKMIGINGNVEIAYLIILFENGVIGFIAWISSLIIMYRRNMLDEIGDLRIKSIINGMILCVLLCGFMSNLFGDPGTLNYIIYMLFAFSFVLRQN